MANQRSENGRVGIIKNVKTALQFYVLVLLVVELSLGAVAAGSEGVAKILAVAGMVLVFMTLILVVARSRPPQHELRSFCQRVAGHW